MTIVQITFSLVCVAASVVTNSPNDGPLQWKKHYDASKQSAQSARRPMLVVIENPSNNNEKIDETKITDTDRKILAAEEFELCRVDVNTDYGKRVAAAFGAREFPYTVVTDDSSKRIVFRKPGQMNEQDWTLALAKSTRQAVIQPAATQVMQPASPTGTVLQGWTVDPGAGYIVIPQSAAGTCFT